MKKIILICLIGIFLLCGCTNKKDDTTGEEGKITSIDVRNINGGLLEQDVAYQQFSSTAVYSHENVKVFAHYSDLSVKDITGFATFSSVDLSQLGEQTVKVQYYSFECSYKLLVKSNPITKLSIQADYAKTIYTVGETYSTNGLVVAGTRENGLVEKLTTYDIKITDINNRIYDARLPFIDSGVYDVKISSGTGAATYQIGVQLKQYSLKESFNVTNYTHGIDGYMGLHTIQTDTTLFTGSVANLSLSNGVIRNKDNNNKLLNTSYLGTSYNSVLEVNTEDSIVLEISQTTDVVILASSLMNGSLLFTSGDLNKSFYYAIRNIDSNLTLYYIRLNAGKYEFHAITNSVWVYNIDFGPVGDIPASNIKQIHVDTTYAKLIYERNEPFNYLNLQVIAEYINGTTVILQNYEWTYKITLNGQTKTQLDEVGIYMVTICHKNHYVSYTITVKETSK